MALAITNNNIMKRLEFSDTHGNGIGLMLYFIGELQTSAVHNITHITQDVVRTIPRKQV